MYIPTEDKLFEHKCQFKNMKLSAFNPKSLTYYCQICGGKFIIEKDMKDWGEIFGEPINLRLNKRVLLLVLEGREEQAKKEEEILSRKEEEARKKAVEARTKALEEAKEQEQERLRRLQEETLRELGVSAQEVDSASDVENDAEEP